MTSSNNLLERDARLIWHPYTQSSHGGTPLSISSAQGVYLELEDGRRLIDGISSWWCNLHGHAHPHIVNAIASQAARLDHVLFAGCTHEPAVNLAEKLLDLLPPNQSRLFFSDNGSTAVEVALKIAIQWWKNRNETRPKVMALAGGYHGDTFGAMAVGEKGIYTAPFNEHLFEVEVLSIEDTQSSVDRCEQLCRTEKIAAFIFEPLVQGATGMRQYSKQLLDQYMQICKQYTVLCIADEVMTGFGRLGPLFVSNELEHKPDMITLSKGLTNGTLPLAVTSVTEELFIGFNHPEKAKAFLHGHTYTANPIACSAALASLQLTTDKTCQKAREMISVSQAQFAKKLLTTERVKDARCLGTILAFEVQEDSRETIRDRERFSLNLMEQFVTQGVLLRPIGRTVYFMPPYAISESELHLVHQIIENVMTRQ